MKIHALIVDDEALARGRIRNALKEETDLEVIGECANGPEAIEFMRNRRPDLVFLDVQMPEVNGFEVLRALPSDAMPAVIFVTAHDQHAIKAFEVNALDYLLKPFTQARFREALGRAREQVEARNGADMKRQLAELVKAPEAGPAWLSRIAIKTSDRTLFIKVGDIDYIESASNYVVLCTQAKNHVLRETMSHLETRLSPKLFLRISRSIIVNLDRVREMQPGVRGECHNSSKQYEVDHDARVAGSAGTVAVFLKEERWKEPCNYIFTGASSLHPEALPPEVVGFHP